MQNVDVSDSIPEPIVEKEPSKRKLTKTLQAWKKSFSKWFS